MRKTTNLELPVYDTPNVDTFKVEDWNKANENIDYVFGEFKNNPNVNAIDIKAREDIINNHRNVTEQLDNNVRDYGNEVNLKKYKSYSEVIGEGASQYIDWTNALRQALSENRKVVITEDIVVNGCVEVSSSKIIEIIGCQVIKTEMATNTDPIFWIKGNGATIKGQGMYNSLISSKKESPNGVILIGHISNDVAHSNVLYNTISNLEVSGLSILNNDSKCIHLRNSEINGLASYFNTVDNVRVSHGVCGICLTGYANANIFSNIQFYRTGTATEGGAVVLRSIGAKVPMENMFSNFFHHNSPSATTISIECTVFYNKFMSICSEQGGTGAKCINAIGEGDNSWSNTFSISPNVNMGNNASPFFYTRNTLLGFNDIRTGRLSSNIIYSDKVSTKEISNDWKRTYLIKETELIRENEKIKLMTFGQNAGNNLRVNTVTIKGYIRSSTNVLGLQQSVFSSFEVKQGANMLPVIRTLNEGGYKITIENNELFITFPTNGTNTVKGSFLLDVEIIGVNWYTFLLGDKVEKIV